ncbi:PPE family protein, SVP subgroup [Mycobacterium tuberculosis]|uniref:PPE family protein, SVP subgroup n=1 Tax=Mycobacterium tuberculosis TaxID=1773 RepID=UPI003267BB82
MTFGATPSGRACAVRWPPAWAGQPLVGYLSVPQGWTEANQANLAAGTEAEPNQALGWLPMQDIDAAAEAAAQPSHALGWLPIEEIDAAASDDGEVSSSPQLPPRPFMMPHTPSGG